MNELGMEPVITLSHYETPLHLITEYGGWSNPQLIDFWLRYVKLFLHVIKEKLNSGLHLMKSMRYLECRLLLAGF